MRNATQKQLKDEIEKVIIRYTDESDLLVSDVIFALECVKFDLMDKIKECNKNEN